jgi:hypothetical protein
MNNRFGFYGFFSAIAFALLINTFYGCASPAQAEQPRESRVIVLETIEIVGDVEAPVATTLVTGEAHTFVTDDGITVDVEEGALTIYN